MKTKHTPTPWYFQPESLNITDKHYKTDAVWVADLNTDNDREVSKANAEFIVTACNAHDELVAALKSAICHIAEAKQAAPDPIAYAEEQTRWLERAHNLLAKAEGGA